MIREIILVDQVSSASHSLGPTDSDCCISNTCSFTVLSRCAEGKPAIMQHYMTFLEFPVKGDSSEVTASGTGGVRGQMALLATWHLPMF